MRLLLDTHILLWAVAKSGKLSVAARALIGDLDNDLIFSSVSLWEVAIKSGRRRDDFRIDVSSLRRNLLDNGYAELAMTGAHAAALTGLPLIHRDPFDRMLAAQAIAEGLTLVTSDAAVAKYPAPIRMV
jgi:PIN domain nuclease of toxin-antitoxin system